MAIKNFDRNHNSSSDKLVVYSIKDPIGDFLGKDNDNKENSQKECPTFLDSASRVEFPMDSPTPRKWKKIARDIIYEDSPMQLKEPKAKKKQANMSYPIRFAFKG